VYCDSFSIITCQTSLESAHSKWGSGELRWAKDTLSRRLTDCERKRSRGVTSSRFVRRPFVKASSVVVTTVTDDSSEAAEGMGTNWFYITNTHSADY
jgi:hypothetical protein